MSETRSDYTPDTRSHPGETIAELILERGIDMRRWCHSLGIHRSADDEQSQVSGAVDLLRDVIDGTVPIDGGIAAALEEAFGGPSADFWLRSQARYDGGSDE